MILIPSLKRERLSISSKSTGGLRVSSTGAGDCALSGCRSVTFATGASWRSHSPAPSPTRCYSRELTRLFAANSNLVDMPASIGVRPTPVFSPNAIPYRCDAFHSVRNGFCVGFRRCRSTGQASARSARGGFAGAGGGGDFGDELLGDRLGKAVEAVDG